MMNLNGPDPSMSQSKERYSLFDLEPQQSAAFYDEKQTSFIFEGNSEALNFEETDDQSPQHGLSSDCQLEEKPTKPTKEIQICRKKEKSEIVKILKKFAVIFGSTFALKLVVLIFMSRFRMKKVLGQFEAILKTSLGTSLLSAIYNIIIWLFRQLNNRMRSAASSEMSSQGIIFSTPATVHLLAGSLASTATGLLAPAERNLLKVFLYMRAVNGFIQLIKNQVEPLLTKIYQRQSERLGDVDEGLQRPAPAFKIHFKEIFFTSIMITICVYGYTVEPEVMNKGMLNKIDQLYNMQDYELPFQNYFQMMSKELIKRQYKDHWFN